MPSQSVTAVCPLSSSEFVWQPRDGLITQEIGAEVLVLDQAAGRIHQFNHTAAIVWIGLSTGKTVDDIASVIAERYDVPLFRAVSDAKKMIEQLSILKLISIDVPE